MADRRILKPVPRQQGPGASGKSASADPRAKTVAPLGAAVEAYLHASGLGSRLRDHRIFEAWNAVVGAELARRAVPARFRNGELLVEVDSSAHLGELQAFTGEQYRQAANRRLGTARIERVVFKLRR